MSAVHGTFDNVRDQQGSLDRQPAYPSNHNRNQGGPSENFSKHEIDEARKDQAITNIENSLVTRLRRAIQEASSAYLRQLKVGESSNQGGSDYPQAEASTLTHIEPENHRIFLRRIMCDAELETALKDVQLTYRPKKARILFKVAEDNGSISDIPSHEWDLGAQLLSKDRFKEFKNELSAELRKLDLKKPVVTLFSARLGKHVYNLVMVHVSFDPDDRAKLDEIRQKISAADKSATDKVEHSEKNEDYRPEVQALIEKYPTLRPIIEKYMHHAKTSAEEPASILDIRFFN